MKKLLYLIISMLIFNIALHAKVDIKNLRTEMKTNPIGIDIQAPRFMWQIESDKSGVSQTAYRIVVAESVQDLNDNKNLVWDSGKVLSDNSIFITFQGKALESYKKYYWKVKVWTNKGESSWSEANNWSMTFTDNTGWKAKWIGLDKSMNEGDRLQGDTRLAARYLRKEFNISSQINSAKIYITGLGFYECYINGERVGKDVFAPTATDYSKRVNYNVYDVTGLLSRGNNTIGVVLGNGRFFSMRQSGVRNFGFPKMLMQLEIEDQNGQKSIVTSDESWKITSDGPIISNSEFDGEEYNANKELKGWNTNGYNDRTWLPVSLVDEPGGKLISQTNPNIQIMRELKSASVIKTSRDTYIVDMGQNMVGWLAIHLNGKKDKPIKMVFAESLKGDSLYLANIRGAKVTDIYTPASDGEFSWEPGFTYHGFRFVEISGLDYQPSPENFTGKVIYDKMRDTGAFESSNATINRIFHNAYWGIIGNYRSMPTDCPQRDERMGWLGDRATGCFGESFMVENALLYEKWIQDIQDSQLSSGSLPDVAPNFWDVRSENVTWPSAYIFAINMLYEQYGDIRPVKQHYNSMKLWINHMTKNYMTDYILTKDNYGDWCMPPERQDLIHSEDPSRKTDGAILSTTFFYRLLQLMSKFAVLNGYTADRQEFDDLARKMKDSYNEKYLNKETGEYGNNTVTANILSLMLGLVPAEYEDKVFSNVVKVTEGEFKGHVSTGLVGIEYLMRGLTKYGRADLAYKIATNKTYPSWGYMIEQGATTIWELWNGDTADPAMNSGNHVMLLGDLLTWYYESLAGISTDKNIVGFKKINMKPVFPEGLDFVNASYDSVYGKIRSEWKKDNGRINWEIEIPANTTAEITLPKDMGVKSKLSMQDKKEKDGIVSFYLPSGKYTFIIGY
ncbi:MAG: glycoside hydrolase family 78 protein [Prevotella sp.]|jgi:alpha-L-rhamnosidase|nr:glycoside hydrolase family 78 protein [Prevotella sp.]